MGSEAQSSACCKVLIFQDALIIWMRGLVQTLHCYIGGSGTASVSIFGAFLHWQNKADGTKATEVNNRSMAFVLCLSLTLLICKRGF